MRNNGYTYYPPMTDAEFWMENCPRCGAEMEKPQVALSRVDDATLICPECGIEEALLVLAGESIYPYDPCVEALNYKVHPRPWNNPEVLNFDPEGK